jgi:Xaa-Pro aminopeptidase
MNENSCRGVYQGDEALAGLLRKAGSAYDVGSLRELVAGVAAAAVRSDSEEWTRLVAADPSPALIAQLQALKAGIAAAQLPGPVSRKAQSARLAALRAQMAELEIDGFLVPRSDEYQNEYVISRSATSPMSRRRPGWGCIWARDRGSASIPGCSRPSRWCATRPRR